MHASDIEVILDVVYNHTAEGNHLGPTLSLRGIDDKSYYYLMEGVARYYAISRPNRLGDPRLLIDTAKTLDADEDSPPVDHPYQVEPRSLVLIVYPKDPLGSTEEVR